MPACCATTRRRDAGPCPGLCRRRSTRPSRRRTTIRCCSCPTSGSARAASSTATTGCCAAAPGSAGSRSTPSAARSASSTGARASPARDLQLTLDLDLQRFCVDAAVRASCGQRRRARRRTGGVLALASVPSFDPRRSPAACAERLAGAARRSAHAAGQQVHPRPVPAGLDLQDDDRAGGPRGRRSRRRYAGLLPRLHPASARPCSTAGRSTATAGSSMIQALGQSCDVYFYDLARRIGIDAIAAMARRFGLGQTLGIDLPGEQPGLIPTRAWKKATLGESWQKGETLVCGIGQGYVLATPLQLAVMAARLANGGRAVHAVAGARPRAGRPRRRPDRACRRPRWTSCSARHARGGPRRARHRPRGGPRPARHRDGRQDRHLAGAPHLARRARRRAAQAQGHSLGRARPRPVRLLRALSPTPRYAVVGGRRARRAAARKAAAPIARDIMRQGARARSRRGAATRWPPPPGTAS